MSASDQPEAKAPPPQQKPSDPQAIWGDDEVEDDVLVEDGEDEDDRRQPEFEILYKQAITSQDVYLNMGFKDSSSTCCDALVVRVALPGSKMRDVNLQVTSNRLLVSDASYKLFLHLPHTVDEAKGKAQWLTDKEVLKLTLPIVRGDD